MSQVVLDTDVWSYLFKKDSRAERYQAHLVGQILCISFQTVAELYQWMEIASWGEKRRILLATWLRRFVVLGYDDETARLWARIRAERARQGLPLAAQDAWVAACALRYGYALVTNNSLDYKGIEDLVVVSESI